MNLPPIVYSLRFWEAVSVIVAAVVWRFTEVNPETVALVLGVILSVLRLIGVVPELRLKGRIR